MEPKDSCSKQLKVEKTAQEGYSEAKQPKLAQAEIQILASPSVEVTDEAYAPSE
jgi:hypothetical protein